MDAEQRRRSSPARGVALIATAVIIGLFVLRNGFDQPSGTESAVAEEAGDEAPSAGPGVGGDGGTTSVTTAAPPSTARPVGEVTVLVANASGVQGAAGEQTDALSGRGYPVGVPTNAPPEIDGTTSQVMFVPGFEADAVELATQIQLPPEAITPMSQPPPVELGDAQLLVLLGTDMAGG